uniref:Uncharacterized protein n=1 Tax=Cacopsylla melanoneura TaxID=428564 RepID=A0A8D8WL93_9HEMI
MEGFPFCPYMSWSAFMSPIPPLMSPIPPFMSPIPPFMSPIPVSIIPSFGCCIIMLFIPGCAIPGCTIPGCTIPPIIMWGCIAGIIPAAIFFLILYCCHSWNGNLINCPIFCGSVYITCGSTSCNTLSPILIQGF